MLVTWSQNLVMNIFGKTLTMNNSILLNMGLVRLLVIDRLFVVYHLKLDIITAVANPKCAALAVSTAASPAAPGVKHLTPKPGGGAAAAAAR